MKWLRKNEISSDVILIILSSDEYLAYNLEKGLNKYTYKSIVNELHNIKEEYFTEDSTKTIYKIINNYANKYKEKPNKTVLAKAINVGLASKNPTILADANEKLNAITTLELPTSFDYMVNETEKFCQNRAMFLASLWAILLVFLSIEPSRHCDITRLNNAPITQ